MISPRFVSLRLGRVLPFVSTAMCAVALSGCGAITTPLLTDTPVVEPVISHSPTSISVPTTSSEDLNGPCNYDLLLQTPSATQAGTLVIFERGDSKLVYNDAGLRAVAAKLNYAMVWAHQCNSESHGDLQSEASAGPARTLQAALTQFGINTSHAELGAGGVILFGFSAAGALSATMANAIPERILGVVEYAPGDSYVFLPAVPISAGAAHIPTLILSNAQDPKVGTTMDMDYFARGRASNAPWAYAVQNATAHCCVASTLPLLLPWFNAVASVGKAGGTDSPASTQTLYRDSAFGWFTCTPNGTPVWDGSVDCSFTASGLAAEPKAGSNTGWLPDQASASAWQSWVTNPVTN